MKKLDWYVMGSTPTIFPELVVVDSLLKLIGALGNLDEYGK
jgi:hypothetical protein